MLAFRHRCAAFMVLALLGGASPHGAFAAASADPFASNNGVLPPPGATPPFFEGPYRFRSLSRGYPTAMPARSWLDARPKGPITQDNAEAYVTGLKAYVAASLRKMIEEPAQWDPAANGWYDMPWMGQLDHGDLTSGREPILGSFSGQVILKTAFAHGQLTADTQNHTVIYYDSVAALTLGEVWKNIAAPDKAVAQYRDGALVVKAGGVAATAAEWPAVEGAAEWRVFRPPVDQIIRRKDHPDDPLTPAMTPLRVMQFDVIVKDREASPDTGWVFATFVYDKDAPRRTGPWDQLVPLGAMWGNDPAFDDTFLGHAPFDKAHPDAPRLAQTWRNPKAPAYAVATMGWGGRMSGPIDIAERHGLILTEGVAPGRFTTDVACADPSVTHVAPTGPFRASACLSCHGTAQSSAPARMYPSPVAGHLPMDGQPFCLYRPGSTEWAEWFQNRPGTKAQLPTTQAFATAAAKRPIPAFVRVDPNSPMAVDAAAVRAATRVPAVGLDYDMLLMFALSNAETAAKGFSLLPKRVAVH